MADDSKLSDATKQKIADNKFFYKRTKFVYDYALETWYEPLEQVTLKTELIKLDAHEIQALYHLCDDYLTSASSKPEKVRLTDDDKSLLSKLETKIYSIIASKFGGEAFAKLNTRSPKDAITDKVNDRLAVKLEEELKKSDGTANGDTCAFVQAARRAFRVTTGKEVLHLFTSSSRIREDLAKATDFPDAFEVIVLIREWKDIQAKLEFRGFVSKRVLTALSQYCYMQYYPDLVANKAKYQKLILDFFNTIKDKIPMENSVVDFVVLNNDEFQDTSACLFDWKDFDDKTVLNEGPFQFRLLEKPVEDPLGCLSVHWRKYIEDKRGIVRPPSKRKAAAADAEPAQDSPSGDSSCSTM